MKFSTIKADILLLVTALIWGTAFVFQKKSMQHLGLLHFNGLRFLLGSLALTPVTLFSLRRFPGSRPQTSTYVIGSLLAGTVLFAGACLQQAGLAYTTAGNGGFITGMYVILTPIFGLAFGKRTGLGTWCGGLLALSGMYFLCITDGLSLNRGDLLVLCSAFFWAFHLLIIDRFVIRMNPLVLAQAQFAVCGILSLCIGLIVEPFSVESIFLALDSILFCGLMSTGVAYTLQVIAQQRANPAHASILLSLEAVFATCAGWFIGETLTGQALFGCSLMA